MKNIARDNKGQFSFTDMDLLCKCGHKLGIHSGENPRPCLNEDKHIDGATGEICECKGFKIKPITITVIKPTPTEIAIHQAMHPHQYIEPLPQEYYKRTIKKK